MSYITREDGERFVVPSYRDIITAKSIIGLKKEVALLCKSYGEYITLQKINPLRYEAAFSPDTGYLLGESIWYQLKRPEDLVYCEAIPNTTEAILVIVKDGSVYLDGRFPLESIPEELIIFLTQKNHFDIYTYGDVPLSDVPHEGKFSFEPSSVKSFKELEKPLFPTLPLLKAYQLQLTESALAAQGIGAFPIKKFVVGLIIVGVLWGMWSFMTAPKEVVNQIIAAQINPYQLFEDQLASPAPEAEINTLIPALNLLMALPGWVVGPIDYASSRLTTTVSSRGANISTLQSWVSRNGLQMDVTTTAIILSMSLQNSNRPVPKKIFPLKQVTLELADKLSFVYPGNVLTLGKIVSKGPYSEQPITIAIQNSSAPIIALIASQLKELPLVLQSVSLSGNEGFYSGSIVLKALGS